MNFFQVIIFLLFFTFVTGFYINPNNLYNYMLEIKQRQIDKANENLNNLEKISYVEFHELKNNYKYHNSYELVTSFILLYKTENNLFEIIYLYNKCVSLGYDPEYLKNFLVYI